MKYSVNISTLFLLLVMTLGSCKQNAVVAPVIIDPNLSSTTVLLTDQFNGEEIVLIGNQKKNFILAFSRLFQEEMLEFKLATTPLPAMIQDQFGNIWDVHGRAISGPNEGSILTKINGSSGYWFSFGALYPGVEIYDGPSAIPDFQLSTSPGWLVPRESVYQGAGFDAIESLENPNFINFDFRNFPNEDFYVGEDDLIIGLSINGESKAYPHKILDQHEVVNDVVGGESISIIYCPLTGTTSVWEQNVEGNPSGFGVSGFLYSSNILPFDRHSESLWSQLEAKCVNGPLIGAKVNTVQFMETTWNTWRNMHNTPKVIAEDTGVDRDYSVYPYSDYITNNDNLVYPIQFDDPRLPRKERVFCIIVDSKAKVYRFESFK